MQVPVAVLRSDEDNSITGLFIPDEDRYIRVGDRFFLKHRPDRGLFHLDKIELDRRNRPLLITHDLDGDSYLSHIPDVTFTHLPPGLHGDPLR